MYTVPVLKALEDNELAGQRKFPAAAMAWMKNKGILARKSKSN